MHRITRNTDECKLFFFRFLFINSPRQVKAWPAVILFLYSALSLLSRQEPTVKQTILQPELQNSAYHAQCR